MRTRKSICWSEAAESPRVRTACGRAFATGPR
jgi:hypothetical protein